jgi:hypothetical protein
MTWGALEEARPQKIASTRIDPIHKNKIARHKISRAPSSKMANINADDAIYPGFSEITSINL